MPDLSLSQLADFANQGKNQANSFARPYMNMQNIRASQLAMPYIAPKAQADINVAQQTASRLSQITPAEVANYKASAGLHNAQANLITKKTPADIATAEANEYDHPFVKFMNQLKQFSNQIKAEKTGIPEGATGYKGPPVSPGQVPQYAPYNASDKSEVNLGPDKSIGDVGQYVDHILSLPPEQQLKLYQDLNSGQNASNAQATNLQDAQQNLLTGNSQANQLLTTQKDLVNKFDDAYDRSKFKGAIAGRSPGLFGPEQEVDQAANALALSLGSPNNMIGGASGQLTDDKLHAIGLSKPSRSLNKESKENIVNYLKSNIDRGLEKQSFISKAISKGLDANQSQELYNDYNMQRPTYDTKNHRINKNFLGDSDKFFSDEAINDIKNNRPVVIVPTSFIDDKQKEFYKSYLSPQHRVELDRRRKEALASQVQK